LTLETEKAYAANIEVQGLEEDVLVVGDIEKIVRRIHLSAGCSHVRVIGVYRTMIR